jgi:hypothetical protein
MPQEMNAIHDKLEKLIDKFNALAFNMSRLIRISPGAAMQGLDVIEANIETVNATVAKLIRLELGGPHGNP